MTERRVDTHELSSELRVAVARLSRRLRAEKADHELSDSQGSVLGLLVREGPRSLGALSEAERVTPPSMNRTVAHLVEAGYVERSTAPEDGRKVVLSATEAGRAIVLENRKRRDAWLYRRLRELDADEKALLVEAATLLRRLADS
jgi:DNA-binding MarR family transcriptional regulator